MTRPRPRPLLTALVAALLAMSSAGCAGSSSAPARTRTPPDLPGFLRQPVATPTSCPSGVTGAASGRNSPWVGHVDVSVYVDASAPPAVVRALGDRLRKSPHVAHVYFESSAAAFAEYQRLYTCSAQVPRSSVPPSYRLVLKPVTHPQRDALVRSIVGMTGVRDVACDPADPCVLAATGHA